MSRYSATSSRSTRFGSCVNGSTRTAPHSSSSTAAARQRRPARRLAIMVAAIPLGTTSVPILRGSTRTLPPVADGPHHDQGRGGRHLFVQTTPQSIFAESFEVKIRSAVRRSIDTDGVWQRAGQNRVQWVSPRKCRGRGTLGIAGHGHHGCITPPSEHGKTPDFSGVSMAVTVGFEPTVGGYPTQLFESCTFGRSDTSPRNSLRDPGPARESRAARHQAVETSECVRRMPSVEPAGARPMPHSVATPKTGAKGAAAAMRRAAPSAPSSRCTSPR